ncbi:MAG: hypothetical protein GX957_11830 [Clostridiaceae bacterium]|nr:hypothetical protein [Clostridiaceae bacterium]
MKTRGFKTAIMVVLTMCLVFSLTACGENTKDYAGTWIGNGSSTLILNSDMTCKYTYSKWKHAEEGIWRIEDNKVVVADCLDYEIYAEIGESESSLLFQSDSSTWNDELFIKSN